VWRYFRFALRYRDVEELLAERGVILTYETVRQWCRKYCQVKSERAMVLRGARPSAEHQRHVAARVREEVLAAGTGARAQRQPLQQVDDEAAARPR